MTHEAEGKKKRHDVVMQEKKKLLHEQGITSWDQWRDESKPRQYEIVRTACTRWLSARAQQLGFQVGEDSLSVDGYTQHRGKGQTIRFSTVDFSGVLTVAEPSMFIEQALMSGIGHAKAFGCGLLLVRRVE